MFLARALAGAFIVWTAHVASDVGGTPRETPAAPDARTLLREVAAFTDADWASVERGHAIAKILDTDTREIAVAGAVRISARRSALVARVRDVENLKRSAVVLDLGRFRQMPEPADLAPARFEEYSLDLRECRPGDCPVRLSDADIARFHRDVDWRAANRRDRALAIWRDVLAGYAAAYAREGRKALPVYANKEERLSVASELSLLVGRFGFVAQYSPEFHAYLQDFGPARAGMEATLYWSKEDFGVRPVVRISHQVIYGDGSGAAPVLIATNQVYADHYLDAALGITLAIDADNGSAQKSAFYMIAVNRARTRSLSGMLRRIARGTVQGRSREALRKILTATKSSLETAGAPGNTLLP